ncbi:hypothetical protein MKEN_01047300 [Mycena kentingensis (nom. inval.)]|nr:hypothetical protein MKEN_01047300 [Mycena kentingensis (nom. inval.)]
MVRALATASASALKPATAPPTPHGASPFSHLLRHSRFATFDPSIRQTYSSPKQFVARGYWGLKRPISARKKNSSFITIKTWEARQHYVEWDNAEDRVRFIRRMEELGVRPGARANSVWMETIGQQARNEWLVDSDFAPRDWTPPRAPEENPKPQDGAIYVDELGRKGPGSYGANARPDPEPFVDGSVIPNVQAMSAAEFKRYLAQLRRLRPAFQAYMRAKEEKEKEKTDAILKENPKAIPYRQYLGKQLVELAQPHATDHRMFLAEHSQAEYSAQTAKKIQPHPHRHAALTYTHPSMLDTLFRTTPKPGIIVNEHYAGMPEDWEQEAHVASFAGIGALLPESEMGDRAPFMDEYEGARRDLWPNAVTPLRPTARNGLMLQRVPKVVSDGDADDAQSGLSGVLVGLQVTTHAGPRDLSKPNPYPPGSREYMSYVEKVQEKLSDPREAAHAAVRGPVAPPPAGGIGFGNGFEQNRLRPGATALERMSASGGYLFPVPTGEAAEVNKQTLNTLEDLLGKQPQTVRDSDLS